MTEWLTTMPNPTVMDMSADAGQRGWRLHIVTLGENTRTDWYDGQELDISPALCGLRPAQGWGLDMFINRPCVTCLKRARKLGIELPEFCDRLSLPPQHVHLLQESTDHDDQVQP